MDSYENDAFTLSPAFSQQKLVFVNIQVNFSKNKLFLRKVVFLSQGPSTTIFLGQTCFRRTALFFGEETSRHSSQTFLFCFGVCFGFLCFHRFFIEDGNSTTTLPWPATIVPRRSVFVCLFVCLFVCWLSVLPMFSIILVLSKYNGIGYR